MVLSKGHEKNGKKIGGSQREKSFDTGAAISHVMKDGS